MDKCIRLTLHCLTMHTFLSLLSLFSLGGFLSELGPFRPSKYVRPFLLTPVLPSPSSVLPYLS